MRASELHQFDWFKHYHTDFQVLDVRPGDDKKGLVRFQAQNRSGNVGQFEFPEDHEFEEVI